MTKKLRVLACAFTCCPPDRPEFAGGEDLLGWSLVQQAARYHDVWVLTHDETRRSIEEELAERPLPNVRFSFVSLPSWMRPMLRFQGTHQFYYYLWQIMAYFTARKLHRQVRFDLFHHITYANDWMVSFIGALLPITYVRGPGGGAHRTPALLNKEYRTTARIWEGVRRLGQWVFRHDPLFLIGQHKARAILVCNRESLAGVSRRWEHKAHLFPVSGVSSADFSPQTSDRHKDETFRVISAGSLIRVKGFGLAIKAFNLFVGQHPNAELCIVGSGPEEPWLRELAQRENLGSKLQLVPALPRTQLLSQIAESDVFLFPSLRDGGGTVTIEAMAVGKPVICLDTGGPGTNVTEECGFRVAPSDSDGTALLLSQALEKLYLDPSLRCSMGQAGRERARKMYHWDRLGDRLMDIYRAVT